MKESLNFGEIIAKLQMAVMEYNKLCKVFKQFINNETDNIDLLKLKNAFDENKTKTNLLKTQLKEYLNKKEKQL